MIVEVRELASDGQRESLCAVVVRYVEMLEI
jgi:hypothetical protein